MLQDLQGQNDVIKAFLVLNPPFSVGNVQPSLRRVGAGGLY